MCSQMRTLAVHGLLSISRGSQSVGKWGVAYPCNSNLFITFHCEIVEVILVWKKFWDFMKLFFKKYINTFTFL